MSNPYKLGTKVGDLGTIQAVKSGTPRDYLLEKDGVTTWLDELAIDAIMTSISEYKKIYCTGCGIEVLARLTNGKERYPHRPDLYELPFWKCDTCGSYVGCHHKTKTPTKPLGYLVTPEILDARKKIHSLLDPLWESKKIKRGQAYAFVSHRIGHQYHNGEIKTLDEAREIYRLVLELSRSLL